MNCNGCGAALDYNGPVFRIDFQEWLLNRAVAAKIELCPACGLDVKSALRQLGVKIIR